MELLQSMKVIDRKAAREIFPSRSKLWSNLSALWTRVADYIESRLGQRVVALADVFHNRPTSQRNLNRLSRAIPSNLRKRI